MLFFGRWVRVSGTGSTFRVGQRLLAQGTEAKVVVQATCMRLLQHFWASIHPLHLEKAPSLQLGEKVASVMAQLDQ